MFYKELLEIQSVDAAVVENFDFWLATLPKKSQKEISVSMVSTQVGIDLATAKQLIEFWQKAWHFGYVLHCKVSKLWHGDSNRKGSVIFDSDASDLLCQVQGDNCAREYFRSVSGGSKT